MGGDMNRQFMKNKGNKHEMQVRTTMKNHPPLDNS